MTDARQKPSAMLPSDPLSVSDPERLRALAGYAILDTPPETGFDDIVQLACQLCAAPVALVSLVAGDRQWFKARVGFPACETDLNSSVCAHSLSQPTELLIITDLTQDARTRDNPLVTGDPFIRFYAGAPLVAPDGHVLGSLCVIDKAPRPTGLTAAQADSLAALARQVMTQLELRRAITSRDTAREEEAREYRAREALRDTQAGLTVAGGDLDRMLCAIVEGAMRAVPSAEGGVVELIVGSELEYRAVRGTLAPHLGFRVPAQNSLAGHCAITRTPMLMTDSYVDPHVKRDLVHILKLRSAAVVPLLRGEAVLGVLKLQSSVPDAFGPRDLDVLALFAGAATTGFTEAEAHKALRARDIYWRGLFDRLSEGFMIGDILRDDNGNVADWRYVEMNPAWGELVGIDPEAATGLSAHDAQAHGERRWIRDLTVLIDTDQASSFVRQIGSCGRWYEGRAFKLDPDHFGIILLEVTARIEADLRRNALLSLVDRLRDLTTISDIAYVAAEIVGLTLGATRAGFGRIDGDIEFVDIESDWTAPGVASLTGRHRFDDYGDLRANLRRGEPLVIDNVESDPRTRNESSSMRGIGIAALVNMPVRERGRTVAIFIVHDAVPRIWTAEELAFLRNVADRVEIGVARIRGEHQQSLLNNELAHRLKNTLAIVQSIANQTLKGVTEKALVQAFDRRVLALSRAHDALLERNWSAARLTDLIHNVVTMQADLSRFVIEGEDLDVTSQAAMSLSLLLHELATNALKYGALSADGGYVRIRWRAETGNVAKFVFEWAERGGPAVSEPEGRTGFGSKLIRMGLLGTREVSLRYDIAGLCADFRAPLGDVRVD